MEFISVAGRSISILPGKVRTLGGEAGWKKAKDRVSGPESLPAR